MNHFIRYLLLAIFVLGAAGKESSIRNLKTSASKAPTKAPTKVGAPSCQPKKRTWPELFGTKGGDAIAIILKEEPCVKKVFIVPIGTPVTSNYSVNRVRLYVDDTDTIFKMPRVG